MAHEGPQGVRHRRRRWTLLRASWLILPFLHHPLQQLVAERLAAVEDCEMQADIALDPDKRKSRFPFADIKGEANVLVFPNLGAAHIAVRLMESVGGASVVGPILMGMRSPVNSVQPTASVEDIVNLAAVTVLQAQKEY